MRSLPRPRMNIQTTRRRAKIIAVLKKVRSGILGHDERRRDGAASMRGLSGPTKKCIILSKEFSVAYKLHAHALHIPYSEIYTTEYKAPLKVNKRI